MTPAESAKMFATLTLIADREDVEIVDEAEQPAVETARAAATADGGDPDTAEGTEHEARGLLNLIGLLSHCLRNDMFPEEERRRWRREMDEARARLERLRLEPSQPEGAALRRAG